MQLLYAPETPTTSFLSIGEGALYVGPGRNDEVPLEVAVLPDRESEQRFIRGVLESMKSKGCVPEIYLGGPLLTVVFELPHPSAELRKQLDTILNSQQRKLVSSTKIVVTVEATISTDAVRFFAAHFPEAKACMLCVVPDQNGTPPLWKGTISTYKRGSPFNN